jgi:hypothetical protein
VDDHPDAGSRPPRPLFLACGVLGVQALALVAAAVIVLIKAATQKSTNLGGAVLLALIALGGAVVLVVCARALLQLRPAARSPAVVVEALALPVSYSLAIQAGRVAYGAPIMLSALAVIYLLFTPPVRAVLDRAD